MSDLLRRAGRSIELKLLLAWIGVIAVTLIADRENLQYWYSFDVCAWEILQDTILLGIFAMGAAIIIIAGGIDLSSGAMIALAATVFACLMKLFDPTGFASNEIDISPWAFVGAIGGTLVLGLFVGTFHTWLITRVGLPPFVATLATLVGLRSLARGLAKIDGSGQVNFSEEWIRQILRSPTVLSATFVCLALVLWILMSRSKLGRQLHALGGNEQAAVLSGIPTDRLKWLAYCLGSLTACVTGIFYLGETSAAKPDIDAVGYELNAIAASVIGGCSLKGGVGTIPGVVLGCLFLSTVIDAIGRIVSDSKVYEGLIVGIVVVVAVAFSQRDRLTRRFFSDSIGWATIPFLAFLAGCVCYFFVKQTVASLVVGGIVGVLLVAWAIAESRGSKVRGEG
ncbi:MAG: ABC transporter permease [Pirellulales bacterium]|nr:ABC transporter permease [Pirellulales bacterium]